MPQPQYHRLTPRQLCLRYGLSIPMAQYIASNQGNGSSDTSSSNNDDTFKAGRASRRNGPTRGPSQNDKSDSLYYDKTADSGGPTEINNTVHKRPSIHSACERTPPITGPIRPPACREKRTSPPRIVQRPCMAWSEKRMSPTRTEQLIQPTMTEQIPSTAWAEPRRCPSWTEQRETVSWAEQAAPPPVLSEPPLPRPTTPWTDPLPPTPWADQLSPPPRTDLRPPVPRSDLRPPVPRSENRPQTPRAEQGRQAYGRAASPKHTRIMTRCLRFLGRLLNIIHSSDVEDDDSNYKWSLNIHDENNSRPAGQPVRYSAGYRTYHPTRKY